MLAKTLVESMVGRKLNEKETKVVEWLAGWEPETVQTILELMQAAHDMGAERKEFWSK